MNEKRRKALIWVVLVSICFGMSALAHMTGLGTPFLVSAFAVLGTAIVFSAFGALRSRVASDTADESGIYPEPDLIREIEAEIARSRRYGHEFAVFMVALGEAALRFDYGKHDRPALRQMTEGLLKTTREKVDKIFRCPSDQFCLILPESGPESVVGLVRRMRRLAQDPYNPDRPSDGVLPLIYGATYYPSRATSAHELINRARMAIALAAKAPNRVHLDGAEAEVLPAGKTLRRAS